MGDSVDFKTALIYGHSQAEPWGMGDAMVDALKARGVKVTRIAKRGRNDKGLLKEVGSVGDPAKYERVFLYAGGNSDVPMLDSLRALINHLGPSKTVLILSPLNVDRDPERVATLRKRNEGNRDGVKDLVPVYIVEAGNASFSGDKIHMKAKAPENLALVQKILADLDGVPSQPEAPIQPAQGAGGGMPLGTILLVAGAALAGILLARRKGPRPKARKRD